MIFVCTCSSRRWLARRWSDSLSRDGAAERLRRKQAIEYHLPSGGEVYHHGDPFTAQKLLQSELGHVPSRANGKSGPTRHLKMFPSFKPLGFVVQTVACEIRMKQKGGNDCRVTHPIISLASEIIRTTDRTQRNFTESVPTQPQPKISNTVYSIVFPQETKHGSGSRPRWLQGDVHGVAHSERLPIS